MSIKKWTPINQHHVFSEWVHEKNQHLDSYKLKWGSNKKAWWVCEYQHQWEEMIIKRTLRGFGCPYCSGRRASPDNCLKTLYPELAKWWHSDNEIGPEEVTKGTHKKIKWFCKNNHTWYDTVAHRVGKRGCPYCSSKRPSKGNNLGDKFPDLIPEWSPKNQKTPFEYLPYSDYKVWWICVKGHEWKCAVHSRTNSHTMSGCPTCKSSKGERKIRMYLKRNDIKFDMEKKFDECKNKRCLPFDFHIPDKNVLIEYDGSQHFIKSGKWYNELNQKRDLIKTEFCAKNNISLIRICHLEFMVIEDILDVVLNCSCPFYYMKPDMYQIHIDVIKQCTTDVHLISIEF